jgi:hypothetical protein
MFGAVAISISHNIQPAFCRYRFGSEGRIEGDEREGHATKLASSKREAFGVPKSTLDKASAIVLLFKTSTF